MQTKFEFTPAQLQWFQEKQIWLEKLVVECLEPENVVVSQTNQYKGARGIQAVAQVVATQNH